MPFLLVLILAILTVYRLAHLIGAEDGPFNVFSGLQARAVDFGAQHKRWAWVGTGLGCPNCISFWLAAGAAGLLRPATWLEFVWLWGGIAGAVLALNGVTK